MSVASGLDVIQIPIKPSNQTTSLWTGSSPTSSPITYLNKGTYNITYNCMIQASVGTLTNCFGIITKNALFAQPNYVELTASCKTGGLGAGGVGPLGFSIQNNIVITQDNTPIYLYLAVTISGGSTWGVPLGVTQYNSHMNYVCIVES